MIADILMYDGGFIPNHAPVSLTYKMLLWNKDIYFLAHFFISLFSLAEMYFGP